MALSGVGLSDVVPITPFARALVMLEEFAGVMYIALVVSRLIGLSLLRANSSGRARGEVRAVACEDGASSFAVT